MSQPKYGGGIGFIGNESLAVSVTSLPGTAITLTANNSPGLDNTAHWFQPATIITDAMGTGVSTLYLAGMWVNPNVKSPSGNVTITTKDSTGESVSLTLPVVHSAVVTNLNQTEIAFGSNLLLDSSSPPKPSGFAFGALYLPTSSVAKAMNLGLRVEGVLSNGTGLLQPLPEGLNIWFTDFHGQTSNSFSIVPYHEQFMFVYGNDTQSLQPNSRIKYDVQVQVTEDGIVFIETLSVFVENVG